MKRSKHLEPLSHDHYGALIIVRRLREGLARKASPEVMADYVSHLWKTHLADHFQQEEVLLLPVCGALSDIKLAERMVDEHRLIQDLVTGIETNQEHCTQELAQFCDVLKSHIRFEERELFPSLETHADEETLREIGAQLHTSNLEGDTNWDPPFWE